MTIQNRIATHEMNTRPEGGNVPRWSASGLLDTNEAAQWLGLSVHTLNGWRSRGGGPRFRNLGERAVRYHIDDLRSFVSRPRASTSDELMTR